MNRLNRHLIVLFASVFCVLLLGFYEATHAQSGAPTITVDKQQLIFSNVAGGGGTASQVINVTSSSAGIVTINTANSAPWLSVSPNGAITAVAGSPTPVLVTATTSASMGPGTYETSFSVAPQNNQSNATTVLVTMTVGGLTLFKASP